MKRTVLLLTACFSAVHLSGQTEAEGKTQTIGVHITPNLWSITNHNHAPVIRIGIDYSKRFANHWSFSSGLEQYIDVDEKFYGFMTSIPVQLKYNYNKHIYFHFGPSLDIYGDNPSVWVGTKLGVGYEYEFKNGLTLSLNPYLKTIGHLHYTFYILYGFGLGAGYKF